MTIIKPLTVRTIAVILLAIGLNACDTVNETHAPSLNTPQVGHSGTCVTHYIYNNIQYIIQVSEGTPSLVEVADCNGALQPIPNDERGIEFMVDAFTYAIIIDGGIDAPVIILINGN